jgi:Helix-turn-helix domain
VSKRQTQASRILALLESKPEVSALELSAISLQYCARIAELREAGAVISNRVEQRSGVRHGFYTLVYSSPILERVAHHVKLQRKPPSSEPGSLFPTAESYHYPD